MAKPELTLLFATDLHGSEAAFRKFVNAGKQFKPDVLVMGGDLAGKAVVPVVAENGHHVAELGSRRLVATDGEEVAELEKTIRMTGRYPMQMTLEQLERMQSDPAEVERLFLQAMGDTLQLWLDLAQERLEPLGIRTVAIAGNDDPVELDRIIENHPYVEWVDGHAVELDKGIEVVGYSWVNPTPWDSPREYQEERLEADLHGLTGLLSDPERSIWNIHAPPFDSGLDSAPAVSDDFKLITDGGQPRMVPVGSRAVRSVLESVQPLVGVHGHVHESRNRAKLGRTLVVNPGSAYSEGTLQAAFVRIGRKGADVQFITA
jgi:Icc-related predicted phosphoesterase